MAKLLKKLRNLILVFGISFIFSGIALADYTHLYDGNVKSVHVIEGATETRCIKTTCVIIQLENITNSIGTQCNNGNDRYVAFELNDIGKSMMSMAISAQATGHRVRVHANGCQGVWNAYASSNLGWLKIFK